MAKSTLLAFSVLHFPFMAKLLAQDVAYSTKTLAAREMALRASLEMLTPYGSASLMILVMTALGRFRSLGLSAIAAAGAQASDLLFRPLRRPDFPCRHGLTQRGFRRAPRCPHSVPQFPARHNLSPPPAPLPPPGAGASELSTLPWFWLEELPSGLTGTWRPFPGSFPCFTPPPYLELA